MCHSQNRTTMNRPFRHICKAVLTALVGVLSVGCVASNEEVTILDSGEVEHTLVMYLLADNNLSASIYNNAVDAEEGMIGALPSTRLVVYLDTSTDSKLYEVRYLPYGAGGEHIRYCKTLKTYPRQTSTSPEAMRRVMEDIKQLAPSRTYGLVMSGHGTGWFPEPSSGIGYEKQKTAPLLSQMAGGEEVEYFFDMWRENPETRSLGYDYAEDANGSWGRNDESCYITAKELVEGLSPIHFDYILFDACFMASVEFLYDMRYTTDYIIASPVEILAVGLPYTEIVHTIMSHTSNLYTLGDVAMDVYMRDNAFTSRKSLALSMIDCSKLDALAEAVAAIYDSTGAEDVVSLVEQRLKKVQILVTDREGEENDEYLTLPYFEGVQPLDRMRPAGFNDLEDFVCALTDNEQLVQNFLAALDDVVVWTCHTTNIFSQGYSLDGTSYGADNIEYKVDGTLSLCGVSTYIPIRQAPVTLSYYLQTDWAKFVY